MSRQNGTIAISSPTIRKRLRRLREQRKLSKVDLAQLTGLSERTVRNIETGRSERILEKTLLLLADSLGVTVEDIIEGDGECVD